MKYRRKNPDGMRFSAPVHTGTGAHPASYTVGIALFPGGKVSGVWPIFGVKNKVFYNFV
jgi:hypothetical protein